MWGRGKMLGCHPVFTMHSFVWISFFSESISPFIWWADQLECYSRKWFSLISRWIAGGGEETRPTAMSLSPVKAMVPTATSLPKMWGRQKMWGRRPFDPKCGDVNWGPEKVGTSTGCGDVAGN